MKVLRRQQWEGAPFTHAHYCPACDELHDYAVEQPLHKGGPQWKFNGDMERPTFRASMKITWGRGHEKPAVCHYFITKGVIEYCKDSTHALARKKVPLPDIPERYLNGDDF